MTKSGLPVLETERLKLRPLSERDQEDIFGYARIPEVSQYTLWEAHQSVADSLDFIQNYAWKNYAQGVPEPFGIEWKESAKLIGCSGAFWTSKENKTMEVGYVLSPKFWGQGVIVEATKEIIKYCFENYDVERMQCRCKAENKASLRVMEKLGMKYEGRLRSSLFHRGRFWDMDYCSILKEEI